MAFRPPKKQPRFADLQGILAQSRDTDSALYQTVQVMIERLTQFQAVTLEQVADINNSINESQTIINITADKTATYLTATNEAIKLPNSRELIAGIGITFDDTVNNERTISSSGGGSGGYAPMSTGTEPLEIMSNGAGQVLMVGFSE